MQMPCQVRSDDFRLQCLQLGNRIVGDTIQQRTGQRDGRSDNKLVGCVSLAFLTASGLWVVCKDGEGADEVIVINTLIGVFAEVA